MDTGITNVSRAMNQPISETGLKQPHPLNNKAGAVRLDESEKTALVKSAKDEEQDASLTVNSVAADPEQEKKDKQELTSAVQTINNAFQSVNRSLQFKLDDDSGQTVVKVIDKDTGAEIQQIPSKEMLALSKKLSEDMTMDKESLTGMLVKSQA